jgi:hypothetical protein
MLVKSTCSFGSSESSGLKWKSAPIHVSYALLDRGRAHGKGLDRDNEFLNYVAVGPGGESSKALERPFDPSLRSAVAASLRETRNTRPLTAPPRSCAAAHVSGDPQRTPRSNRETTTPF